MFYHEVKSIRIVVHGDDFTVLRHDNQLDWFREKISETFEVKFRARLGPSKGDDKSVRILNRVVEWTTNGINYEADQRHAELIVKALGFQGESRSSVVPGEKRESEVNEEDDEELNQEEAREFRRVAARGVYINQDRSDIAFSVKEISRGMSKPIREHQKMLKKLGRYLINKGKVVTQFNYQGSLSKIIVWVDSDWAGCIKTRRSTSAGVVVMGSHMIKHWSSQQGVIALSSVEAEYHAIVKGSTVAIGIQSMYRDMEAELGINIKTDAVAAKGISSRLGLGKVRHTDTNQLWV